MTLQDAIVQAGQILDQERVEPTVRYETVSVATEIVSLLGNWTLAAEQANRIHPLIVREKPQAFQFRSVNFDLLCAILEQLAEPNKSGLFSSLLSRFSSPTSFRHRPGPVLGAGSWKRCSSELPLIAEFTVRRGDKRMFLRTLSESAPSPGLTLLLLQLEQMIALNFTLFTSSEYSQIPTAMVSLKYITDQLDKQTKAADTLASNTRFNVVREVPARCDIISEACRKAAYLYVKGSLLPGMNLELNQDKSKVQSFLEKLGFSQLLIESLNEAERLYREAVTPFELKSSMAHLRSFLENLHIQAGTALQKKLGGTVPAKWGDSTQYLRDHDVLSVKEQQFVIQFYALVSDTSVHPLVAEREYARLIRNMSIEYGLLLLTKLDKLGLN